MYLEGVLFKTKVLDMFFYLMVIFTFFLDEKSNKKIKPENKNLENYLEVPLRSPNRSSFVLNSRTAAASLLRCFPTLFI
jgi:hypothetical protein